MKLSTKHILIFIITISTFFIIYPEILLTLFNITAVSDQMTVVLAIRISSISLMGRCLCMIIANYTQSITSFKISAIINLLQEGILPFVFMLILIPLFGGLGIWITLALADAMPVIIYIALALYQKKNYASLKDSVLMIPKPVSFHWTSIKGNFEKIDDNMHDSNKKIIEHIKGLFDEDYLIIAETLEDIAKNIFTSEKTISEIDMSIIINHEFIVLRFIHGGHTYNPFENSELLNTEHIKSLNKIDYEFDYYRLLDMNFSYVNVDKDKYNYDLNV